MKMLFRKLFWIVLDIFLLNISFLFAIILRFGNTWKGGLVQYQSVFWVLTLFFIFFSLLFKMHQRIWRYISINDLLVIVETLTATIVVCLLYLNLIKDTYIPVTVKALTWFISLSLISGNKLIWRLYWEKRTPYKRKSEKVLIVGAGDAGLVIAREISKRPDLGFLVGFLDDDIQKIHQLVHNKRVLGSIDQINDIIEQNKIGTVIIAIPSAKSDLIRRVIELVDVPEVKIKTVPGLYELLDGEVSVSRIRDVEIADLLGREKIELNMDNISHYIQGKTVMVTGGAGSIGREICHQVARFNPGQLLMIDLNENDIFYSSADLLKAYPEINLDYIIADIRDREKMQKLFGSYKPDVVFHVAAHKHVPLMEYHPDEAIRTNVLGTHNLVFLADQYGVDHFVMISTDKAINPTSVMGASKQVAEKIVQVYEKKSQTLFVSVRFGNVLGSNGSVIPTFKEQIAEGGPITVTHKDIKRYFMTIPEASQLVIQAGELGSGGQVFVLDMGEPVKIVDLAKNLIKLSGLVPEEDIKIQYVGLRPGEKMFEELLTEKEKSRQLGDTGHEKIFIAETEEVEEQRLMQGIEVLEQLARNMDNEGIVKKLQEMVPTYQPNREMLEK